MGNAADTFERAIDEKFRQTSIRETASVRAHEEVVALVARTALAPFQPIEGKLHAVRPMPGQERDALRRWPTAPNGHQVSFFERLSPHTLRQINFYVEDKRVRERILVRKTGGPSKYSAVHIDDRDGSYEWLTASRTNEVIAWIRAAVPVK